MNLLQQVFVVVPVVALLLVLAGYVFRSGFGRRARLALTLVFVFCCSRYYVGLWFFGSVFYPEFPEWLHWSWCWAYVVTVILAGMAAVTWGWKARCKAWLLPAVSLAVATVGLWNGICLPDVREVEVRYPDLPDELDGYRIVQLSDLHVSAAARRWRTQAIVDRANALGADLVCLTGDYVDGYPKDRRTDIEPLRDLRAKDGVWFIPGNHEYYFDWQGWMEAYREMGFRFLVNSCVFPRKSLALAGVSDPAAWRPETPCPMAEMPDVAKAFAAATNGEFRVLLQHQPKWAVENERDHGVRLQLSGHTHGGIMPVLSLLVRSHNEGFLRGLYDVGRGKVFVHSGSGQWAGCQLRYFDPAEIVVITLRK